MKGSVIKYARDNIDTDVILPGPYLKIHDYAELATHAMEGLEGLSQESQAWRLYRGRQKLWLWLFEGACTNCIIIFWNQGSLGLVICKNILQKCSRWGIFTSN